MSDAVVIALAAIPGAWLRFWMVNHLQPVLPRRHWGTFVVNLAASFALGLITPLLGGCGHGLRIHLLLATGFLGSLSTFSSFVVEVLQSWMLRERRQSILLMAVSVFAGLMAVYVGASISG